VSHLQSLVGTAWAEAVGWTLLHSLWQGAVAAVVLTMLMLVSKSSRVRYTAGCLAMLGLLCAFGITLLRLAPHGSQQRMKLDPILAPAWKEAVATKTEMWTPSLAALAPWLPPFWIGGMMIFYLRFAAGIFSLSRLRKRGVCSAPAIWQRKLAALQTQLRLAPPVVLLESSLADVPMLIGHFKPLILMPVGLLAGLPAAQIEAILLHELAHIRRHDYLLNAVQNMLDGFLFYNPAVWWISHVIRSEREKCCDDFVVAISGNAQEYARALTALEEIRWSGREPAVAAKGGSLMKRVRRLLYPSTPSVAWTPVLATCALFLAAAVTVGAWQNEPPRSKVMKSCPPGSYSATDSGAFQHWLNQDVFYIIDDAEREAFQKLKNNDERACFIYEFWERRNPNPGSSKNKFKEEHYRRIEYANKHFAASVPGWQTDRGHMYIVYGPPDEIDSHTDGKPHPYQTWGYRHIEGGGGDLSFFMFVDRTGHGDYHLAPSSGH